MLKRLLKSKSQTAADLRLALNAIPHDALIARLDELRAERVQLLLDDEPTSSIKAIDAKIEVAALEVEKAIAAACELQRRIDHADRLEAIEALEARRDEADAAAKRAAAKLADIDKGAKLIVGAVIELGATEELVRSVNEALQRLGASDRVTPPLERARSELPLEAARTFVQLVHSGSGLRA